MSLPTSTGVSHIALQNCLEYVAPVIDPTVPLSGWPLNPGEIQYDAAGRYIALHFAPDRWLVPDARPEILAALNGLDEAGLGTLVDVSGKWQWLQMNSNRALRALGSCISVDAVSHGRSCAAVTLFDCPTILSRSDDHFDIWVMSSYAESFLLAVEASS